MVQCRCRLGSKGGGGIASLAGVRGLTAAGLAALVTPRAPEELGRAADGAGSCAICLGDLAHKNLNSSMGLLRLRKFERCGHIFHADCIDECLQLRALCPLCKTAVV